MLRHLSDDEKIRLQTLDELKNFDKYQDETLNTLTTLTCQLLQMPTALVTLSGTKKQHIAASTHFALSEMEKIGSFDHFVVQTGAVVVCEDALLDAQFKNSPYVTGTPQIRFYAGVPLNTAEGYAIGTLSVIDYVPRSFSGEQLGKLADMAKIAMTLIDYRNAIGLVDAVTLLPNRQRLIEDIERMTDIHENYLLVLIDSLDISYAYQMGRSLGMPTVEAILKDIGMFLRLAFHSYGSLYCAAVGRFALLVKTNRTAQVLDELVACAERIKDSITSHVPLKLELFAGYTAFQIPADDPQRILRESMSALQDAISSNVRYCAYNADSDKTQQLTFTLLNELSDLLKNGKPGLYLIYQPKLNIKNQSVIGVEALIRWHHPQLGDIYPDQFIPLAEGTTLMRPLTEWVIKQASGQLKIWRQAGLTFSVSINIAASNFAEPNFIEQLIAILENDGLTPLDIQLECLETQKIIESSATLATIQTLSEHGFVIAIDDFGAGYSNLNYLRNIPATLIKLDKSLIKDISSDHKSRVIVESIISMLHQLDYNVLAEGVENKETLDYLTQFGCDAVQGYYFSRPVLPEALTRWLAGHAAATGMLST